MAGDRIDEIAVDLRKSEVTKDLQTQATKTIDAVQKSEVTKKAKQGLLSGLKRLNDELTGCWTRARARRPLTPARPPRRPVRTPPMRRPTP